ncbi:hypothetical protein, partial [Hypericibacter sp.]|uniref:hypothetical protein n=1 Tax=Hypericibacter sp. TaxID=2705401 RepID=UPI003D6CF2DA
MWLVTLLLRLFDWIGNWPIWPWLDKHEGLAAWAQFVGAMIAIGIAIIVPWNEKRLEVRALAADRRLQARSLAIAIYPELLELKARVLGVQKDIERITRGKSGFQLDPALI